MMQKFSNNASTTVAVLLTNAATTVTTSSSAGFVTLSDEQYELVTLTDGQSVEIIKVTARTGNTWTVERAQEGTAAAAWPAGTTVEARVTAGSLDGMMQASSAPDLVALDHGGNARGTSAVNLQPSRSDSTRVASGYCTRYINEVSVDYSGFTPANLPLPQPPVWNTPIVAEFPRSDNSINPHDVFYTRYASFPQENDLRAYAHNLMLYYGAGNTVGNYPVLKQLTSKTTGDAVILYNLMTDDSLSCGNGIMACALKRNKDGSASASTMTVDSDTAIIPVNQRKAFVPPI